MGNPWGSSPAHRMATSRCPHEDPSVPPKTPPGASGGPGSSHSFAIGDVAVGLPQAASSSAFASARPTGLG